MSELTQLEREVLAAAARRDEERTVMEQQIKAAEVASREYTGVGFHTKLVVSESSPALNPSRWQIGDMPKGFAEHPDLPAGAGFIIWLKGGRLIGIEGYTNQGNWPADETAFRVAV
jgi:hypothetical protein